MANFFNRVRLLCPATVFGHSFVFCDSAAPPKTNPSVGTFQHVANKFIEDRIFVSDTLSPSYRYFLVLDGHGGPQAAEFLTFHLPRTFSKIVENTSASLSESMRRSFLEADAAWYALVKPAYDAGFTGPIKVGACAVCVAVTGDEILVGSAGDCKCVLARKNNKIIDLNVQRNANLESEQARLRKEHPNEDDIVKCKRMWTSEKDNFWLSKYWAKSVKRYSGCYVKGRLQPTKSFGDFHLKLATVDFDPEKNRPFLDPTIQKSYPYISSDPDVTVTRRTPDDDFLIIATDGLWDQFSSEEAVRLVREYFAHDRSPEEAAAQLVHAALANAAKEHNLTVKDLTDIPPGSGRRSLHDDISVCIVRL